MSQEQVIQVKLEAKQGKFSPIKSPMLQIGALLFVILAILAFGTVSANEASNEAARGDNLSQNPELSAARRSVEVAARGWESDYMAINPELKLVLIYAELAQSEDSYRFAANPELKIAQRYAGTAENSQEESSTWIANPELSAANRFAGISAAGPVETSLYQNQELKTAVSQALTTRVDFDSDFLATNPEVKAHQRFLEGKLFLGYRRDLSRSYLCSTFPFYPEDGKIPNGECGN